MDVNTIASVVTFLLTLFLTGFALHLNSYFKKKGANLADREDLKELTQVVEEVRKSYLHDLELLKSSLAVIASKQTSLFDEEKKSLIEFFAQWNVWVWDSLRVEVHEYFHGNYEDLNDKIIKLREAYNGTQIAFSKVQLLVRDPAVVAAGHEMVTEALKLSGFVDAKISALKRNLSWSKIQADSIIKSLGKQQQPLTADERIVNQEFLKMAKENEKEREDLLKGYGDSFLEKFTPSMRKRDAFMELTKSYLNDLK